jgi:hypothetical protein
MYVGKANCFQDRVWRHHSGMGPRDGHLSHPPQRRQHPRHRQGAAIEKDEHRITPEEAARVHTWLNGCE